MNRHRAGLGAVAAVAAAVVALVAVVGTRPAIGSQGHVDAVPSVGAVGATVVASPHADRGRCAEQFEEIELAHTTRASDAPARLFDSNGSGIAADDLDQDGLPDIVLGNLEGPNTILWNEGEFVFTREHMRDRSTRSVNLVDVDGDGLLDIVTTHRASGIAVFRNLGGREFDQVPLRGVGAPAYSMSWGDLDADGDLDLATASYDAELDQRLRSAFQFSDGAGVYVYRRNGGRFDAERLATDAQGLVTSMTDLDRDGVLDLFVGNDFSVQDLVWHNDGTTLTPAMPFERSAAHPMSFDTGDVDGDGVEEIFVTDMRPATTDTDRLAEWIPLMSTMNRLDNPTSRQKVRNVLHVAQSDGTFRDDGERAGVDAAGWAWSARFGDLDNDRDVDLHVVNGMIAAETFHYLPNAEIVEPNITFVNRGNGSFGRAAWGLDSLASGRGSVLVDLDVDGRLDVVVNNLDSPALAYRNLRCDGGAVTFALRQPGTGNTHAIGATVTVVDGDGRFVRTVRAGSGYLSGSPSTVHVGVGDTDSVDRAEIRWPDGTVTVVERPEAGNHYLVTREGAP
jgi:enediyne biosynthesis protein E4